MIGGGIGTHPIGGLVITSTAATQALTASLFTDAQTFYSPTVTATRDLTPSLFTNTQTFPSATVTATYALVASLLTNSQTFYSPIVHATYSLTPALFTDSQSFYSATITTGPVDVAPDLFTDAALTFYTHDVHGYNFLDMNPLLTNNQVFYVPVVSNRNVMRTFNMRVGRGRIP